MAQVIKIEIPVEVIDNTEALSGIIGKLKGMDDAAKTASRSMEKAGKQTGFEKSYQKTMRRMADWGRQRYQSAMEIKDEVSPVISKISAKVRGFTGKVWTTTLKVTDMATAPIRKIGSMLASPLAAAGIGLSATALVGGSVSSFAGFEAQMSEVKAISGATQAEFTQLMAKAKEMGASTKFTAQESGEAFNYMAMAGWKTKDMLSGIEGVLNLAAASGEDLGTTSDIVTDAITAFGMKASDAGHFSDVLAQASSNANTNVSMMGESFKYVAPVAGAMKYSVEDTSLALGLMANASVKGGNAGTSLRTAMANMASPTDKMAAAMQKYNISLTDGEGSMKTFRGVMENLRSSLGGLSEAEQTAAASTIFGKEAMSGMLAIVNASEDDWNKLTNAVDHADGASKRMADTMLDNLSGKFTLFKSALEGVKNAFGERIAPYLMDGLDWLTKKMPDVQNALMNGMDRFDRFTAGIKIRISEFTDTPEWDAAGLFGKINIAWDGLVAEPFKEWWAGGGKEKMGAVAKDIGLGLGTGISAGILTLLGIDVSSTLSEGESIGAQFAKGFSEGFQGMDIMGALGSTLSGAFANASKLLPGGQSADLSSWLSAAMLAKIGLPLLGMGAKGMSLGKGISTSAKTGTLSKLIGSFTIGDELAGVGTASGTGLMGLLGKTGMALGSGASTAGGLAAAGAASIAGGAVGGIAAVGGVRDLYKAAKAKDNDEQSTYLSSGVMEIGGAGLGAAIGTMILPGVGTLVGAGIGGLAGMLGGNKVKDMHAERVNAAEKSEYALEGATFASKELEEAYKDTSVSAAEFGSMMQEAASEKIRESFGNLSLSMQEIQDAAKQIVFGGDDSDLTAYTQAAAEAENSLGNLQGAADNMAKLNWKAGLGMINDEESVESYRTGIESMVESAKQYVEDKHYEATAAVSLLLEPEEAQDYMVGVDSMYQGIQDQLNDAGKELTAETKIALKDGVITWDEQKELNRLQQKVTDITTQLADSQSKAEMQALQIKYSGADLDADSFMNLMSEVKAKAQTEADAAYDAMMHQLTDLNSMKATNKDMSQAEYQSRYDTIKGGYQKTIEETASNIQVFPIQTIAEKFGSQLDGILPEIEGTTAEKLATALNNARANGIDATQWSAKGEGLISAVEWLGLDGLEATTQSAIASMMGMVASLSPEQLTTGFSANSAAISEAASSMAVSGVENADMSGAKAAFGEKISEITPEADFSQTSAVLSSCAQSAGAAAVESADFSAVSSGLGTGVANAVTASFGTIQPAITGLYSQVGSAVNSAFSAGFNTSTTVTIRANYKLANPTATISFSGGGSGTATVSGSISSHAKGGYSNGPELTLWGEDGPEVIIPLGGKRRQRGIELWKEAGEIMGVSAHANGGIIGSYSKTSPADEDFYGGSYGDGQSFGGYGKASLVDGGFCGESYGDHLGERQDTSGYAENVYGGSIPQESDSGGADSGGKKRSGQVVVNVNVTPQFEISDTDENKVLKMIRANIKELANDLGAEISVSLSEAFENMPA